MAGNSDDAFDPASFLRVDGTFDEVAHMRAAMKRDPVAPESDDVLLSRLPDVIRLVLTRDAFTIDGHTHKRIDSGPSLGRHFQLKSIELSAPDRIVAVKFGWEVTPGRLFGLWWDLSDLGDGAWCSDRTAEGISESILLDMDEVLGTTCRDNTGSLIAGPEIDGVCWIDTPAPFDEGTDQSWRMTRQR
jgi:hypothetical protein